MGRQSSNELIDGFGPEVRQGDVVRRRDHDNASSADRVDRGEERLDVKLMLDLQPSHFLCRRKRAPAGDEQLPVRVVLGDAPAVDVVLGAGGDQVECDDAFAAALPALSTRFLEGHVQAGEGVEVALGPGFGLGFG